MNTRIAELARRQHGVVALWQLRLVDVSRSAVQRRIDNGLLWPLHPGVYAVGNPRASDLGGLMAARLAVGPGSAVSHHAAGALAGFDRLQPWAPVDVMVPRGRARARRDGICLHHTRSLPDCDLIARHGIWSLSVPRTLVELAGSCSPERLTRLYEEADRLRLIDDERMAETLGRLHNRRGVVALRELHAAHRAPVPASESHAEHRFFRLWEGTGKPMPEVNAWVADYRVDFLWRELRLIVELDGPSFHDRRGQGERDRVKDVDLALAGLQVHRFGTDSVYEDPQGILRRVSLLIDRRARELGNRA